MIRSTITLLAAGFVQLFGASDCRHRMPARHRDAHADDVPFLAYWLLGLPLGTYLASHHRRRLGRWDYGWDELFAHSRRYTSAHLLAPARFTDSCLTLITLGLRLQWAPE